MKRFANCLTKSFESDYHEAREGAIHVKQNKLLKAPKKGEFLPEAYVLSKQSSGISFGKADDRSCMIGIPEGTEGNILVVGGNGSGKSSGVFMPTLASWKGVTIAIDLKGELSSYYTQLYQQGLVTRPCIVFDPMDDGTLSYDPFYLINTEDDTYVLSDILEIAYTIIPKRMDLNGDPFWEDSERAVLAAGLLYYCVAGMSFPEAITRICSLSLTELCKEITSGNNPLIFMLLGEIQSMKPETIASIDRGLRNKLIPFATDTRICHALRGSREGASCFDWNVLRQYNIFIKIPINMVEQWSAPVQLLVSQLIHFFERRPEKYEAGGHMRQTLVLLDEFPRFGRLNAFVSALTTLRSKCVNFMLAIQSLSQLDHCYGEIERRIIMDNCQYQVILQSADPESQKFLSDRVGTSIHRHHSISEISHKKRGDISYQMGISEVREPTIFPHELAVLGNKLLLLCPHGCFLIKKNEPSWPKNTNTIIVKSKKSKGEIIVATLEKRLQQAERKASSAAHQDRVQRRKDAVNQRKIRDRLKYIFGELICQYFPKLYDISPADIEAGNADAFYTVDRILRYLSDNEIQLNTLIEKALSFESTSNDQSTTVPLGGYAEEQCVSGHTTGEE